MPVARKLIILVPLAYTVTMLVAVIGIVLWAVARLLHMNRGEGKVNLVGHFGTSFLKFILVLHGAL